MINDFEQARKLFPHTKKTVYFNTAAYGVFCTSVADAITLNLAHRLEADKDETREMYEMAQHLREGYAALIGAREHQIGLSMNTSYGLNVAAFGLPLNEGDEVLVSDIEFPAGVYAWRGAAEIRNLKLIFLESKNMQFNIEGFERAISKKTKVLSVSFVQFFNGYKNQLARLSEICKRHNIYFVVDGIQGTGAEPIDVKRLGIDVFSCGCQKWLLSPFGSGFFYISDEVIESITPPVLTWHAADWKLKFTDLFKYDLPFFDSAQKFEAGYYVTLNLLGMKESLGIISGLGVENIQQHNHSLIDCLAKYLNESDYFRVTSSLKEAERSSILTFTCDAYTELHRLLLERKIITACREGSIRVAVHLFNNEDDINQMTDVLHAFEKERAETIGEKSIEG